MVGWCRKIDLKAYHAKGADGRPNWTNREWRLDNLYAVVDRVGRMVPFWLKPQQRLMLRNMHTRNLLLKYRQMGGTTFWLVLMFDTCMFEPHKVCALLMHDKQTGVQKMRIIMRKMHAALDPALQDLNPIDAKQREMLLFKNGSSLQATASMLGGTTHVMHWSEFGKICANDPKLADSLVNDSLPSVSKECIVGVESTGEGNVGYFAQWVLEALDSQQAGRPVTSTDWKLLFFGCQDDPDCTKVDWEGDVIPEWLQVYFDRLEKDKKIVCSPAHKAWYLSEIKRVNKTGEPGNGHVKVKNNFPHTPEEAMEDDVEGSILEHEFDYLYRNNRIGHFPFDNRLPVDLWMDIGRDTTAIWFSQDRDGMTRFIRYYENKGHNLPFYAAILKNEQGKHGYVWGRIMLPHDGRHSDVGMGEHETRWSVLEKLMGCKIQPPPPRPMSIDDDVELARAKIIQCQFHEVDCGAGLKALKSVSWRVDARYGVYARDIKHNWASHGFAGFRTYSKNHTFAVDERDYDSDLDPVRPMSAAVYD